MTANINIEIDASLKKKAERLFSDLGMNMATAMNIFLCQSVRENRIPFEISKSIPNAKTVRAMEDVVEGRDMSPAFKNMKDLVDSLNA